MRHDGGAAREAGFGRGDWVFVHPDEGVAPRALRGLAGRVTAVDGDRVTVEFGREGAGRPLEVDAAILRRERRRRDRPPARWSPPFAQSA